MSAAAATTTTTVSSATHLFADKTPPSSLKPLFKPQPRTTPFSLTHKNPSKICTKNSLSDVNSSFQSYPDDKVSIFDHKDSTLKPLTKTTSFAVTHKTLSKISSKNPLSDVISSFESYPDDKDSIFDADDDKPREECGVVGIYGDPEASRLCYLALHALQHRGQEGAGIVTATADGVLKSVTGVGLVSEVFNQSKLDQLPGDNAIGHVRYSTAGQSMLKNVQPFVAGYRFGRVGVAHNGNLVNYQTLRAELEENGSIFGTSSDTEVVLHLIAISKQRPFFLRIVEACEKLKGAYSMVFLTEDKLVAVRDPFGFRPLVMGRRSNGAIVFASETCALDLIEATYEREVNPGELLIVDKEGVRSICLMPHPEPKSGTTSSKIVRLLKEAGAKEVHMRIASPPIIASCYYGVDTPSSEELISNRMSVEEIREFIGCDSLAFLQIDSLKKMLAGDSPNFCYACFSGNYPVLPSGMVKRVGDFVDDGLNGSIDSIDGGWLQGSKEGSKEKDLDVNYEEEDGKVAV
ncbi:putative amidophosphoribosyltransferase [Helianthus debilis subsp. tardiflorus]